MRFMTIWKPDNLAGESEAPPTQEDMDSMGQLIQEMAEAGVLVTTDGLAPSSKGARVRRKGDKITVTDGPFTEAKELVAGFAIVNVASKEEAVEWTRKFLAVAGDGESEVRMMYDEPAFEA